nr:MAG TPA: hypothetical protein [Caudoviricetes sp.]
MNMFLYIQQLLYKSNFYLLALFHMLYHLMRVEELP